MEKEVQNLIIENNELLATKNALNIVKDDLIAKVDELQSEVTMCREEIQQRNVVKERLKQRISQLEEELKKTKDELEEVKQKENQKEVSCSLEKVELKSLLLEIKGGRRRAAQIPKKKVYEGRNGTSFDGTKPI